MMTPAYAYTIDNPVPQFTSIGGVFGHLLPNLLAAAGLLTFLYLILGGFKYLTAGGDEKAVTSAKDMLTNAIIGLIIIFASWWIMHIVEIIFGITIL